MTPPAVNKDAPKVFIDSNVPMYVAGADHEYRDPARRFLERVEKREFESCTSTEVLQEILCRYSALARRDLGSRVYDLFVEACPEVLDITLADLDRAKDLILPNRQPLRPRRHPRRRDAESRDRVDRDLQPGIRPHPRRAPVPAGVGLAGVGLACQFADGSRSAWSTTTTSMGALRVSSRSPSLSSSASRSVGPAAASPGLGSGKKSSVSV